MKRLLIKRCLWTAIPLLILACVLGVLPMTWEQQAAFGVAMCFAGIMVGRVSSGRLGTLVLVMLSICATTRYGIWRVEALRHYLNSPWQAVDFWNVLFMCMLLGAEMYTFVILYLGYMQTISPLRRPPVLMPENTDEWPTVDLFIPTFNEPLDVVRYTALAASQLDWPADKLNIVILDDGNRPEFRAFAEEAGVGYIARPEHSHAKAGNINYALARTSGELVAIFDCDHVPTRSFLQVTAGWFVRDPKLGMLQTPHHFYSPDPFERNLGHFRQVPNEGELFYGVIQDANDFWNATFFCGSCAVLRRTAIEEVGGIAHETVTEDAHTSLRMQKRGWGTAYINIAQSAGLATETLADHVKQRVRWARGMAQILRVDNPLLGRGLSLAQRLCYLNAMLHFLYALPRLIFLTAPILYLVFGRQNIPGSWLTILVFAIPHLVLSTMTNSRVQGHKRYSLWNEVYETVLSPYILLPTLFALISPKFGKFNVTAKGQNLDREYFDSKLARPYLALLVMNLFGLAMAVPRYLYWDRGHGGTIAMNVAWTLFNIVVLGVTLTICWESLQRRKAVRVVASFPVCVEGAAGAVEGMVEDISVTGTCIRVAGSWQNNETVRVSFPEEDASSAFAARVVGIENGHLRLQFEVENIAEQSAITRVLFLKADRWLAWSDGRKRDSFIRSFCAVFASSLTGFRKSLRLFNLAIDADGNRGRALAVRSAAVLFLFAVLFLVIRTAHGEGTRHLRVQNAPQAETVEAQLTLKDLGAKDGLLLDRDNRSQTLNLSLPNDVLVSGGAFHLRYALTHSGEQPSTVEVVLNDTVLAAVTPSAADAAAGRGELTIPVPPELLVRSNRLTLRLADPTGAGCGVTRIATAPVEITPDSGMALNEQKLVLANDLGSLPEPFVQRAASQSSTLPIVFAHAPSSETLESAGVLVSWFGSQTQVGQTSYPARIGSIPRGNAVLILLAGETLAGLPPATGNGPQVSVVDNPADGYGKLLVLSAPTSSDLLLLARAMASGQLNLAGDHAGVGRFVMPAPRKPDDAPLWIRDSRVSLESLNGGNPVQTTDTDPWNLYLRLSPDFDYGPDRDIYLHLVYGTNAPNVNPGSSVVVRLNGVAAGTLPLHSGSAPQTGNLYLGSSPASTFANTLQTQFYLAQTAAAGCDASHFNGTLGKGSYLDLGHPVHMAKLPNLNLFSAAGFPFTRMADLSESAVLLPDHPSTSVLSLYLSMMGYFGSRTGYPALRLSVGTAAESSQFAGKDLLIIGDYSTLADVPWLQRNLPLRITDDGWKLSVGARISVWAQHLRDRITGHGDEDETIAPDGVIEQVESPLARNRTAVLMLGRDKDSLDAMVPGLLTELPHDSIRGDVTVWQGGTFTSHNYGVGSYYVGDASWFKRAAVILPNYPVALLLALVGIVVLLAVWLDACINRRIERRLTGLVCDLDRNPIPSMD